MKRIITAISGKATKAANLTLPSGFASMVVPALVGFMLNCPRVVGLSVDTTTVTGKLLGRLLGLDDIWLRFATLGRSLGYNPTRSEIGLYVILLGCGDTMFLYCDGELLLLTGSETDGMLLLG